MRYKGEFITLDGEVLIGELIIEDKIYFEECNVKPEYVFTPTFFNAHTHLGDSIAKDPDFMNLEQLVGPSGFKFKVLSSASDEELIDGIKKSIEYALSTGTSTILDFREGGIKGFNILKKADEMNICLPLTRPSNLEEAEELAKLSFGFGMSSVRDHNFEFLEEVRRIAKREGIIFAIHAGEKDNKDVEDALTLEPDLLVHMNRADVHQLKRAMDEDIPIVSCIRSNAFFGLLNVENYRILLEYEKWLIGTDNVMIAKPSMLEEMHFASFILRNDKEIYKASVRGFELFDIKIGIVIFHRRKNLYRSMNIISSIVRRVGIEDIERVIVNRTINFNIF